jgi:hypothetical protein
MRSSSWMKTVEWFEFTERYIFNPNIELVGSHFRISNNKRTSQHHPESVVHVCAVCNLVYIHVHTAGYGTFVGYILSTVYWNYQFSCTSSKNLRQKQTRSSACTVACHSIVCTAMFFIFVAGHRRTSMVVLMAEWSTRVCRFDILRTRLRETNLKASMSFKIRGTT